NGKMNHAYLFYGPEKVGKTATAKLFAKSVLCENSKGNGPVPCDECSTCRQFEKGTYADLYWLERATDEKTGERKDVIIVEQVRDLIDRISKRAFLNNYKIVIIPEAQFMNAGASNCLLKTLEEPTVKTIIILIGPSKSSFLPTIVSRCQSLQFLPVNRDAIYDSLVSDGVNRSAARELAAAALGRPTIAKKFLAEPETWQKFQTDAKELVTVLSLDAAGKFKWVDSLIKKGLADDEVIAKLDSLERVSRDILLAGNRNQGEASNLLIENEISSATNNFSVNQLTGFVRRIEKTKRFIRQNVNVRFALENLLLNI
ncbi:MAG: DNA polymerase III subunit delta', partial [Parcubacteria group bacterium]